AADGDVVGAARELRGTGHVAAAALVEVGVDLQLPGRHARLEGEVVAEGALIEDAGRPGGLVVQEGADLGEGASLDVDLRVHGDLVPRRLGDREVGQRGAAELLGQAGQGAGEA